MQELSEKTLNSIEGVEEAKGYMLVNNWGYTFKKNGIKYDVRFWENCYGVYLGYFTIDGTDRKSHPHFYREQEQEMLEYIKNEL